MQCVILTSSATNTDKANIMDSDNYQDDYESQHDSAPQGFEDWNDFNDYCDEFERGLDWE